MAQGQLAGTAVSNGSGAPSGGCISGSTYTDSSNSSGTALWTCTGSVWVQSTGGSPQVYPGAGIAASTGSAWGTSLTAPSGTIVGTIDTQTLTHKDLTDGTNTFPTLNQNTTGTAAALTTTPTLCSSGNAPTGITAGGNATGCTTITGGGVAPGSVTYLNANTTTSASTTLISTGMTFALAASTTYTLDCQLQMKVSTNATNGFSVGLAGPGTPTEVTVAMDNWTSQTARRSEWSQGTAWGVRLGATATTYSTNPLPVHMTALVENGTTSGTLTIEFSNVSTTGTVTVYRGSWCKLQ